MRLTHPASARWTLAALAIAIPCGAFALPNPASVFCEKMGGRSELATLKDGSVIGLCFLKNQQIWEEWTLFRMHNGHAPAHPGGVGSAAPASLAR